MSSKVNGCLATLGAGDWANAEAARKTIGTKGFILMRDDAAASEEGRASAGLESPRLWRVGFGVSPKQASDKFAIARRNRQHAGRMRSPGTARLRHEVFRVT